jgi:hypothetical protein
MEKARRNPFNGRTREDPRFLGRQISIQIINLLFVVREMTGLPNKDIATLIGGTSSTLSMAVGGRAGEKKMIQIKGNLEDLILK